MSAEVPVQKSEEEEGEEGGTSVQSDGGRSGRKRYQCPVCAGWFSSAQYVVTHTQTVHKGEKNFVCSRDNCGKSFGEKGNLIKVILMSLRCPCLVFVVGFFFFFFFFFFASLVVGQLSCSHPRVQSAPAACGQVRFVAFHIHSTSPYAPDHTLCLFRFAPLSGRLSGRSFFFFFFFFSASQRRPPAASALAHCIVFKLTELPSPPPCNIDRRSPRVNCAPIGRSIDRSNPPLSPGFLHAAALCRHTLFLICTPAIRWFSSFDHWPPSLPHLPRNVLCFRNAATSPRRTFSRPSITSIVFSLHSQIDSTSHSSSRFAQLVS
jgi:hypothetical protein